MIENNHSEDSLAIELRDVVYRPAHSQFELAIRHLAIKEQEKVALIGPSGSGKTSLLSLISGQLLPLSGQIEVLGKRVDQSTDKEREQFRLQNFGFVFQDFRLIDYLTVAENITLKSFLGAKKKHQEASLMEIAEHLELTDLVKKFPQRISQGEKQRTAIGRAIYQQPRIILADEPTGNLDSATAAQTLDYLFKMIELSQATLLLVTHDRSLLDRFDRTIDLQQLV